MERSFARATRYGFKRARWRRLWRVRLAKDGILIEGTENVLEVTKKIKESKTRITKENEHGPEQGRTIRKGKSAHLVP